MIAEISINMYCKLKEISTKFDYFSLAFDESSDLTGNAQLLIFIRGIEKTILCNAKIGGIKKSPRKYTGVQNLSNNVKI